MHFLFFFVYIGRQNKFDRLIFTFGSFAYDIKVLLLHNFFNLLYWSDFAHFYIKILGMLYSFRKQRKYYEVVR